MNRSSTQFHCANPLCNAPIPPGRAKCLECGSYQPAPKAAPNEYEVLRLCDAPDDDVDRIPTGAFDVCFGGGLVRGSVYLIGGAPGGGKSTLSLQLAEAIGAFAAKTAAPQVAKTYPDLSEAGRLVYEKMAAEIANLIPLPRPDVLYVASEEKISRIKMRAKRLYGAEAGKCIIALPAMGRPETFVRGLAPWISGYDGGLSAVVVDSLSGLCLRDLDLAVDVARAMKVTAVARNIPLFLLDHVNKEEELAGLMTLQHDVDCTSTLFALDDKPLPTTFASAAQGTQHEAGTYPVVPKKEKPSPQARVLKTLKNREGPAPVSVLLQMTERGLVP
jgi:DNA repair protein RadA/Sms